MADGPLDPAEMTAGQLVRRDRLVRAVIDLVDEGADEHIQMKEIAERADVALGTVYRYFSSKDHLVAAALVEWAGDLERTAPRAAAEGSSADRLAGALATAMRAYQRRPAFARLLVMVATSTDPHASACYASMGPVVFGALGQVIADVDADRRDRILFVIGAVWYHCMVEWVNGRMTVLEVDEMLTSTAHLLL